VKLPASVDLWVGGAAAAAILAATRGRARHLARLDDVVPSLAPYTR
jgi:hypothetical protein